MPAADAEALRRGLHDLLPASALAACRAGSLRGDMGTIILDLLGERGGSPSSVSALTERFPMLVSRAFKPPIEADESVVDVAGFWLEFERLAYAWEGNPGNPPWRPADLSPAMLSPVLESSLGSKITSMTSTPIGDKGYVGAISKVEYQLENGAIASGSPHPDWV